eukprot:TRINITY_DN25971_c0_g1_i3.p1 TRINITY_DN25971_c0_g1~~TRINITY_DN25971_c0_g1_i3.p1  ORF type:complete len:440 (+),score=145.70 TRINITY_DN25971_c0_g1_i3:39-1322(+)
MPGPFSSLDIDDVFAYKTSRRVVIRDRKLGFIRLGIIVAIFVYVVIYEVVIQRGYLEKHNPVGFVRTSVRSVDWSPPLAQQYCCAFAGCVTPAFGSPRGALQCVDWDYHTIVQPPSEEFSVFITTRVSVTEYQPLPRDCQVNATPTLCGPWQPDTTRTLYVNSPERLSMLLAHGVHGRGGGIVVTQRDMDSAKLKGQRELNFCGGPQPGVGHTDLSSSCDDAGSRNRPGDIFLLSDLLATVGIDLDELHDGGSDTRRYDGVVLLLFIEYSGTGIDTSLSYEYDVVLVPGHEYKYEEVLYRHDGTNVVRQVWNRHGVRVIVVQSGFVADFNFAELMKTLVIGLSLIKIARFLVEKLFIPALPLGWVYKNYRDVKTVDFSDYSGDFKDLTGDQYIYGTNHTRGEGRDAGSVRCWRRAGSRAASRESRLR